MPCWRVSASSLPIDPKAQTSSAGINLHLGQRPPNIDDEVRRRDKKSILGRDVNGVSSTLASDHKAAVPSLSSSLHLHGFHFYCEIHPFHVTAMDPLIECIAQVFIDFLRTYIFSMQSSYC